MALVIMSSVSWAVRNRILTSGCRAVMTSAARMPASMVSISMSIRITSQGTVSAREAISSPEAAEPTTSLWADTTSQKSSRSRGKSSATITRIVFAIV